MYNPVCYLFINFRSSLGICAIDKSLYYTLHCMLKNVHGKIICTTIKNIQVTQVQKSRNYLNSLNTEYFVKELSSQYFQIIFMLI